MTLKITVIGLNTFLTAIYHTDMRLSILLERLTFTPAQIEHLRRRHTETLTHATIDIRRDWFIITRRYALDGHPIDTLEALGRRLNISRERIRQLQKRALRRYGHPAFHRHLETELTRAANAQLT